MVEIFMTTRIRVNSGIYILAVVSNLYRRRKSETMKTNLGVQIRENSRRCKSQACDSSSGLY